MRHAAFFIGLLLGLAACSSLTVKKTTSVSPQLIFLSTSPAGTPQLFAQATLDAPASRLALKLPSGCSVYRLVPNPVEAVLAAELECGGRPAVWVAGTGVQPGQLSPTLHDQARLLAWSADGRFLYLKTGLGGEPQVTRFDFAKKGAAERLPLPSTVYDLAGLPDGRILYSTTQGIGSGSQIWQVGADGRGSTRLLDLPLEIAAYLRPSPDGSRVAFIRFPDSQVPFPNGTLWVMDSDGHQPSLLAEADAGHGFAPAWSPDSSQIAFVERANPDDPQVELSASVLRSNLYRIAAAGGTPVAVTDWTDAIVGSPLWSPDGTALLFNVARNDTIQVWDEHTGALQPLADEASCCAVWVPGR